MIRRHLTLACFASALTLVGCWSKPPEKTEAEYIAAVAEPTKKALQNWDPKPLNDLITPDGLHEPAKEADTKAFAEAKEKFGKFISLGDAEAVARDGMDTTNMVYATPVIRWKHAEFEKGKARVEVWIRISKDGKQWKIDHYKVVPES